jgi:hypothetical protein
MDPLNGLFHGAVVCIGRRKNVDSSFQSHEDRPFLDVMRCYRFHIHGIAENKALSKASIF